jgi:hypothetical protein
MRAFSTAALVAVLALPAQVLACPVCSPGRDDATREAFFGTTVFMSLLPLAVFGAILYWFIRRARAAEALYAEHELSPTTEE